MANSKSKQKRMKMTRRQQHKAWKKRQKEKIAKARAAS